MQMCRWHPDLPRPMEQIEMGCRRKRKGTDDVRHLSVSKAGRGQVLSPLSWYWLYSSALDPCRHTSVYRV